MNISKLKIVDHIDGLLLELQTAQETAVCDDRYRPDQRVRAVLDLEKIRVRTRAFAGKLMLSIYDIEDRSR
jgi:hypothetical protein